MKNGMFVNQLGDKCWYKDDLLHRTDGPAVIWPNGYESWYLNGKWLSREKWLIVLGHKKESL
jgi:hypothetical protein